MDLQHVNVKLFVEGSEAALEPLVPIFHQWIQQKTLEELLLDVADYRHMYAGPGVILIGHEANYSLDNTGNRLGLLYNRKAVLDGTNQDRLRQATRAVLTACRKLESDPRIKGKFHFAGSEIGVIVNDRLLAPNEPATRAAFEPELKEFCGKLFGGKPYSAQYEEDPRKRFGVHLEASQSFSLDALLANVSA